MRTTVLVPEAIIPRQPERRTRWGLWLALLLTGMAAGIALAWSLGLIRPAADEPLMPIEATAPPPATNARSPYPTELPDLSGRAAAREAPILSPVAPPPPIAEPPRLAVEPPAPLPEPRPSRPTPAAKTVSQRALVQRQLATPSRPPAAIPAKGVARSVPPVATAAMAQPRARIAPTPARSLSGSLAALFGPGDIPAMSRRAGEQGDVTVRLTIGTDGRVAGCTVLASNASNALEAATCDVLTRRARFAPASDSSGAAESGAVVQHIAWR